MGIREDTGASYMYKVTKDSGKALNIQGLSVE